MAVSKAKNTVAERHQLLRQLYGSAASDIAIELERLLEPRRSAVPTRPWSHDDVWVIAYPDHFQRGGERPLATLRHVLDELLPDLFSGVHVLPFYPSSSDEGFAVIDYRTVDSAYGTWEDIRRLSTARRLMVDAVINHMSTESPWFVDFLADREPYDEYFVVEDPSTDVSAVVRPRTHPLLTEFDTVSGSAHVWCTFSADQVDLNYRNPAVLLEMVDLLLGYVDRGASVIRLDAVGFLWKEPAHSSIHLPETHAIVRLFRSCLDEVAPGTVLITETNVPHDENVSYLGDDQREAHAVYQFALAPLLADAVLNADPTYLVEWAGVIEPLLGPGRSFLNFVACHDGIGVRPVENLLPEDRQQQLVAACERVGGRVSERILADGSTVPYELNVTWFDLLTDGLAGIPSGVAEATAVARHLATHAVMLALPGVAAIYAPSLFAESMDFEGFDASGSNRSLNRRRFADLNALTQSLKDPASRPAVVLAGLERLIGERRTNPAFHPEASCQVRAIGTAVCIDRAHEGNRARWLVNLGPTEQPVEGGPLGPYEVRF